MSEKTKEEIRAYCVNAYNAHSTDDGTGSEELESYESFLERQLVSRIDRLDELYPIAKFISEADIKDYDTLKGENEAYEQVIDGLDGEGDSVAAKLIRKIKELTNQKNEPKDVAIRFYEWMIERDYVHNIKGRVEKKFEIFQETQLKQENGEAISDTNAG
jgi:hypothetical protein